MPGNIRAHMTAKMVIASAARLIDVRQVWRKRKRIAEMSVPACPIPIQNTKFVMSHDQPTGTLRPQMPIPSQNSHETATPRMLRSATEGMKKSHQPIGVFRSIGSATASVIEWKSGERRISVGWPATGLSSSSASVWAKRVPRLGCEESRVCTIGHCGSQATPRPELIHVRQLRENRVHGRLRAREHRRVPLRVKARLRITQPPHQIDELLRVIRVERDHEVLIVDAVAVARVQTDALERGGGGDMLVHHPLPRVRRKAVPRTRFREGVHEQVLALSRQQFDALSSALHLVDVRRPSLQREEAIHLRQIGAQLRPPDR